MSKVSILMLAAEFPPYRGGVAMYSDWLANELVLAGYGVHIITTQPGSTNETQYDVTRTPAFWNHKYLKIIPLFLIGLWRALYFRPSYLIAMKCNHEGIASLFISGLTGIPYLVTGYGSELLQFERHKVSRWVFQYIFGKARVCIAISGYTERLIAFYRGTNNGIFRVRPGTLKAALPAWQFLGQVQERRAKTEPLTLLTVSRLVDGKGHDKVLEALASLNLEIGDFRYVVIGAGPNHKRLEAATEAYGLSGKVSFLGSVSDDELHERFARADIYIMASRQQGLDVEGFGIAFLEAGLYALPSIAGNVGGVPDAVVDGETGILVDPNDTVCIANAIRELALDPEHRLAMGERARQFVLKEFSPGSQRHTVNALTKVMLGITEG